MNNGLLKHFSLQFISLNICSDRLGTALHQMVILDQVDVEVDRAAEDSGQVRDLSQVRHVVRKLGAQLQHRLLD